MANTSPKPALYTPKSGALRCKAVHFGAPDCVHEGPVVEESPTLPTSGGFSTLMKQRTLCSKGLHFLSGAAAAEMSSRPAASMAPAPLPPAPAPAPVPAPAPAPAPVLEPSVGGKFRFGGLRDDNLADRFKPAAAAATAAAHPAQSSTESSADQTPSPPRRRSWLGQAGLEQGDANLADRFKPAPLAAASIPAAAAAVAAEPEAESPSLGLLAVQGREAELKKLQAEEPEIRNRPRWGSLTKHEESEALGCGALLPNSAPLPLSAHGVQLLATS